VTVDGGRLTNDPSQMIIAIVGDQPGLRITPPREDAVGMLAALINDPLVGAEARVRLGYVYWVIERDAEARTELQAAANATRDPNLKYLARYLLGWIALQGGDTSAARRELALALEARPHSQSAALALASIELREGDAAKAYDRAEQSLTERRTDDDPWRLFLYGHHPHLPKLLADMRSKTR
jgi:Tfp pilus assembly protein PilF